MKMLTPGGMLLSKESEFSKLDHIDQKVCIEILIRDNREFRYYIPHLIAEYEVKGIQIDKLRIEKELADFLAYTRELDRGAPAGQR